MKEIEEKKRNKVDLIAEMQAKQQAELDGLSEIGDAPELNSLTNDWLPQIKASYGLLTANDDAEAAKILQTQFPDATVRQVGKSTVIGLPSGEYVINKEGISAQDGMRFLTDALAFTPAGRAKSVIGAIGRNAATEAAIDASKAPIGGDGVQAEDTIMSGALGGGFKTAENAIGAVYRARKGKVEGDAAEIIQAGSDNNVDVLTSDIKPPSNFVSRNIQETAEKIPLAGTARVRESQQSTRVDALKRLSEKYGNFSYESIVDSLKKQKDRVKSSAGKALSRTAEKLDGLGDISIEKTTNSLIKAVNDLDKKGVLKDNKAVNDLYELADTILDSPQTFSSLKENRTAFREIANAIDASGRSQLTSKAKSSLNSVLSAMSDDMASLARKNLSPNEYRQWVNANSVYASEARKLTKTRLKNVLDKGDVKPEAVETMLFSRSPSELRSLYRSLTNEGRENARSAIIQRMYQNAINAGDELSPNIFATQMKKNGLQIDTFFKGKEKRAIKGFQKLLNATRRAQDASITTPTGQSLFLFAGGSATALAPVETLIAGGTLGGLSRLFETAAVRNALASLDSLPPRSTQFEKAALEVSALLNSTAQAYDGQAAEE